MERAVLEDVENKIAEGIEGTCQHFGGLNFEDLRDLDSDRSYAESCSLEAHASVTMCAAQKTA